MANPHKGEVELKTVLPDGKDGPTYVLRYSVDVICSLEAALGKGFPAIAVEMANPAKLTVTMVRQVLHAGLMEHHPDLSLKEAGELIVSAGGVETVMARVDDAFRVAFLASEAGKASPPKGPSSRRTGSAS